MEIMYVCRHQLLCLYLFLSISVYISVSIYPSLSTLLDTETHMYEKACVFVCVYINKHTSVCKYVCVYHLRVWKWFGNLLGIHLSAHIYLSLGEVGVEGLLSLYVNSLLVVVLDRGFTPSLSLSMSLLST